MNRCYDTADTIAAIATPPGTGGIGIVRVSGSMAKHIACRVFMPTSTVFTTFVPRKLHRGRFIDTAGLPIDDILAVFMPAPNTFTGEDVVELHCHGGPAILRAVMATLLELGARLAMRGEFSYRALRNGRMDLTQAEAIAEMIAAPTPQSLHALSAKLDGALGTQVASLRQKLEQVRMAVCIAVDFPDDEVECLPAEAFANAVAETKEAVALLLRNYQRGRCWQEGASVVLAGAVNAGKSSLLNALLGRNRALVTDIPGTTRDFLEEYMVLDGLPVRITDTAGLRKTQDTIEQMGIQQSQQCLERADVVVLVLDGAQAEQAFEGLTPEHVRMLQAHTSPILLVWNKNDITPTPYIPHSWQDTAHEVISVSAKNGTGLDTLSERIRACILMQGEGEPVTDAVIPNVRQAHVLEKTSQALEQLEADITRGLPYDVCAVHLDSAVALLGEIIGLDTSAEVLNNVFATFCIGK